MTGLGGDSPVDRFEAGDIDYVSIDSADARWIAYDAYARSALLPVPAMSTDYYGFDTTKPPFDDVRVRQAFGAAVDWRSIARLAVDDPAAVATSMVPPGIPDRTARDTLPAHDPEAARALLAAAGYRTGSGFPRVTLVTGGSPYDQAIVTELERELGIRIDQETMDFDEYFDRLDTDPPQMWFLSWVADYPARNDFLGVLLRSDSVNNYGHWASPEFDAALAEAGPDRESTAVRAAFDKAEGIIQRDVPVIPMSYGTGWALRRRPARRGPERARLDASRGAGMAGAVSRVLAGAGGRDPRAIGRHAGRRRDAGPRGDRRVRPAVDRWVVRHGARASQPVTLAGAVGLVQVLVTTADSPAPLVREVTIPFAGGATTCSTRSVAPTRTSCPTRPSESVGGSPLMASPGSVPRSAPSSTTIGSIGRRSAATSCASIGTRATRRSVSVPCGSASVRSRILPSCSASRRPNRSISSSTPTGRLLRRPRAGDARERRRPGGHRDPDPLRRYRAFVDRRPVGRERRAPRTDPSRVRHGRRQPVSLPAALAE